MMKGLMGGGSGGLPNMEALMKMIPKDMLPGANGGMGSLPEPPPMNPKLLCGPGVVEAQDDWSRWCVIYPHYIDASKSVKQGRRVGRDMAVENPTAEELYESSARLGLRFVFEDKCYPRDALVRGRVRVDVGQSKTLKNDIMKQLGTEIKNNRHHHHKTSMQPIA